MQTDADSGPAVVGWWTGEGSLIDDWNPDAVGAWHAMIQPVLECWPQAATAVETTRRRTPSASDSRA